MKIRVEAFTGAMPRAAANLLPASVAQIAENVKLSAGSLRPVNTPKKITSTSLVSSAASFYMLGQPGSADPLSWAADVDVAASPISDDEYRVYYTGDGLPKKTNLDLATTASAPYPGTNWYYLGVPAPTATPVATPSTASGSVPDGTYIYVFTCVTQFGTTLLEESAPSPPVEVTISGGPGNVALTGLDSPVSITNRNYVYKRIYRTTGTAFQLVAQIAFANTTYTDSLSATAIPGDALLTASWLPPPDDLKGICALPSGVLAGFRENEVWFCEPGYPHAWPVQYMQALDTKIVGIKAFGSGLGVATQGYPYFGSGVHPEGFTFQKMPFLEPCLSKGSVASDEFGMLYISANGVVSVGSDGSGLVSGNAITRDELKKYAPESFVACVYERRYYAFYTDAIYDQGGFVFSRQDPGQIIDLTLTARSVAVDQSTARMLFINSGDNSLYQYDPIDSIQYTYTWKSKMFQLPGPTNFTCFRIVGRGESLEDELAALAVVAENAAITAANASIYSGGNLKQEVNAHHINEMEINGSTIQPLIPAIESTVGFTLWGDGDVVHAGDFERNKVHRLPAGFQAEGWEFAVSGQKEVLAVEIAHSPKELANG